LESVSYEPSGAVLPDRPKVTFIKSLLESEMGVQEESGSDNNDTLDISSCTPENDLSEDSSFEDIDNFLK
jgi:hypothetical protein